MFGKFLRRLQRKNAIRSLTWMIEGELQFARNFSFDIQSSPLKAPTDNGAIWPPDFTRPTTITIKIDGGAESKPGACSEA